MDPCCGRLEARMQGPEVSISTVKEAWEAKQQRSRTAVASIPEKEKIAELYLRHLPIDKTGEEDCLERECYFTLFLLVSLRIVLVYNNWAELSNYPKRTRAWAFDVKGVIPTGYKATPPTGDPSLPRWMELCKQGRHEWFVKT